VDVDTGLLATTTTPRPGLPTTSPSWEGPKGLDALRTTRVPQYRATDDSQNALRGRCAVARFYRGVGIGSYHHGIDLRTTGISPRNPGGHYGPTDVMHHIARGTTTSPCISLTKSYGVAEDYARNASRAPPTATNPAYVYEIDIPDPAPPGILVVDPIFIVASQNQNPLGSLSYHHDGNQDFLLGVVNRAAAPPAAARFPPGMGGGLPRTPNLTLPLETMVYVLRDAEVLVVGNLPQRCVLNRYEIY
jgi:hypothetical protein